MNKRIKVLSLSSIAAASFISISLLASCGGDKSTGYSVTYHAGTGYTINGKENFTATNVRVVNAKPAPDSSIGRKFTGWYTTKDFNTPEVQFPLTVTANTDLYAKWVYDYKDTYTVTFNSNGGTKVNDNIVEKGKSVEYSPYTVKTGYTFTGWYKNLSDDNPVTFPFSSTSNIELIAKWKQTSYQPLLHATGLDKTPEGTEKLADDLYRITDNIKVLKSAPNVSKEHYNFLGWYDKNDESGQLVEFPLTLTSDNLNLYAKFENSGHTVTLKDDLDTSKSKTINLCTYIPYAPAPIIEVPKGKEFDGWTLEDGTQVSFPYTVPSDITLKAKWKDKVTCTITYKDDKDHEIETKTYFKNDIINDPLTPTEERHYFTFDGWYSDKGIWKKPISFPFVVDNDYTFYAKYTRSSFAVEFLNIEDDVAIDTREVKGIDLTKENICPKGREGDYTIDKFTFTDKTTAVTSLDLNNVEGHFKDDGVTVSIYCIWKSNRRYRVNIDFGDLRPSEYFYPTGASFQVGDALTKYKYKSDEQEVIAWTNKDGTHTYSDTDVIDSKEMTFYAKWHNIYRDLKMVTFDNPTEQDKPKTVTLSRVKSSSPLAEIQHREDSYRRYELAGYYKSSDGETFESTPTLFKTGGTPNKLDDTWKAAKEYWVLKFADLDVDYGDGTTGLVEHVPATTTIKLKDYVTKDRTDYKINGYKVNGESKTPEEDITLEEGLVKVEVIWERTAYTVTYDYNYEGAPEPFNKTGCNTFDNSVRPPKRENPMAFDGWYKERDFQTKFNGGELITEDTTAYAKWSGTSYTVTFNVGKTQAAAKFGDGSRVKTFEAVGTLTEADFPICSCTGNLFDGWYTSETGGTKITEMSLQSGNHEAYAHWTPIAGFVTLCLKADNDGYFESTGTDTLLISVPENSYFYNIKNTLPVVEYPGGNFALNYYSYTSGGEKIYDWDQFTEPKFLYAVDKDNPQTPSGSFEADSWATIINVAENGIKDEFGFPVYQNGLIALKTLYPGIKTGLTKDMTINGRTYKARIVGIGQDYGDENRNTRLPLTFDFTDSVFVSGYGSEKSIEQSSWSKNYLHSRLNKGGDFYNAMPSYLTKYDHIATTYKWSKELYKNSEGKSAVTSVKNAVMSSNKMFVPCGYEINATTSNVSNYDFVYQLYEGQLNNPFSDIIRKKYLNLDYCCYHTRGDVTAGYYNFYIKITADASSGILKWTYGPASVVTAGRAICPFFCIGQAYTA